MDLQPLRATVERIVGLVQEGHEGALEALRGHLTAWYPSQLVQAVTDGPVLFGVLALIWLRPRVPGIIDAWFLITYGVLRILSEALRQPDAGVPLWLGLSRGQALSTIMVAGGLLLLVLRARRDEPKLGGLLPSRRGR
jgi:prolipoprotein diacylglyceryltransferase